MANLALCKFEEAFEETTQLALHDGKTGISTHLFAFRYQNEVPYTQHFTILNSKMLSKVHSCNNFSKYIYNLRQDYNLTLQNLFNGHKS